MGQHFTDPKRASDPTALPDLETFFLDAQGVREHEVFADCIDEDTSLEDLVGWYYQPCLPGCLPDGEPHGPFDSEEEALEDARSGIEG